MYYCIEGLLFYLVSVTYTGNHINGNELEKSPRSMEICCTFFKRYIIICKTGIRVRSSGSMSMKDLLKI